jgi:hypothetical protein
MKPERRKVSWRELSESQRIMVPPHIAFPVTRCDNCRHWLSWHYNIYRGSGMTRVACSEGKCGCPGIKIQGKLIDEFKIASEAN